MCNRRAWPLSAKCGSSAPRSHCRKAVLGPVALTRASAVGLERSGSRIRLQAIVRRHHDGVGVTYQSITCRIIPRVPRVYHSPRISLTSAFLASVAPFMFLVIVVTWLHCATRLRSTVFDCVSTGWLGSTSTKLPLPASRRPAA